MVNKAHLRSQPRSRTRRGLNQYSPRQRFLIVCEGLRTEPHYFEGFRAPGLVLVVEGTGCNTLSLVREALRLSQEETYDQIWCVFDRDDNSKENFNAGMDLARKNGFQVAYSNQAFELWYLLHFVYLNTAITRQDYIQRLERFLRHKYEKDSRSIYAELLPYRSAALRNARRLLETYQPKHPVDDDPSTTVHLLVEQLLLYAGPVVR
ncbi:MAG: RloB domain-containing protein [Anaerolineales bacterium]|nr:RloB domain-containing protein [Anaerolineales bacterium]